jgi:hypothetical protein
MSSSLGGSEAITIELAKIAKLSKAEINFMVFIFVRVDKCDRSPVQSWAIALQN